MLAFALPAQAGARVPAFWRSLAQCETGGRWNWGELHRPGEGPRYEGGLGFYAGTWTTWREQLGVRYVHAWQAPPSVQVEVAAWGLAHGGYWGCLRNVPRSRYPRWTPAPHPWLALVLV
jgi:Transglycosylase-like domain